MCLYYKKYLTNKIPLPVERQTKNSRRLITNRRPQVWEALTKKISDQKWEFRVQNRTIPILGFQIPTSVHYITEFICG